MPLDGEWRTFMRHLFKYQWTAQHTEPSEEIMEALWNESQGIIDIAIKLFVLSQMRAIRLGQKGKPEIITVPLIETVAKDSLKLVKPMLDALRRKDWKALAKYEDLTDLDSFIAAELQNEWYGPPRSRASTPWRHRSASGSRHPMARLRAVC